jgi:chemotaxis protein MotB
MSRGHSRGRRRGGGGEHEESGERWLLTYADMITLLMALFMVLFSISSVNISKYKTLQESLKAAFSGNILPGGKAIAQQGSTANASHAPATFELQAIEPVATEGSSSLQNSTAQGAQGMRNATAAEQQSGSQSEESQREESEFAQIARELNAYAAAHGFSKSVEASVESRGLVIRVLTDDLLFPSGQATLDSQSYALLGEIAQLLNIDETHPIDVEGNTDNVPIHSAQFSSNWELSTARASSVVEFLAEHGVAQSRLTATGNSDQQPADSNATPAGRARNRRVEIVMRRLYGGEGETHLGSEP